MPENILNNPPNTEETNPSMTTSEPQAPALTAPIPALLPGRHDRLFLCDGERRRPGDCDIVFFQSVYQQITRHLTMDTTREHGGLLLGRVISPSAEEPPTLFITHSLPARRTEGTSGSLTFTEETWIAFQEDLEKVEELGFVLERVGWYHSHPNWGIFLSKWDLDVCSNFPRPTHVALVVDPIRNLGGFFVNGKEGYNPRTPQGFWERADCSDQSVVHWRNMSEATLDGGVSANVISTKPIPVIPDEIPSSPNASENSQPESQADAAETPAEKSMDESELPDSERRSETAPVSGKPHLQLWQALGLGAYKTIKWAKAAMAVVSRPKDGGKGAVESPRDVNEAEPDAAGENVSAAPQSGETAPEDHVTSVISVAETDNKSERAAEAVPKIRILT